MVKLAILSMRELALAPSSSLKHCGTIRCRGIKWQPCRCLLRKTILVCRYSAARTEAVLDLNQRVDLKVPNLLGEVTLRVYSVRLETAMAVMVAVSKGLSNTFKLRNCRLLKMNSTNSILQESNR